MAFLKTEPPGSGTGEPEARRLARLEDYLTRHGEELDYVLTHLDGRNMNGNRLSLPVSDGAGQELGALGWTGGGLGMSRGEAGMELREDGAYLTCGGFGLRVTASGIEKTADGRTWTAV